MSELQSRFVKRGLWVDQSEGPVMGKTITTDTKTGTILIALLAVLSSLAMTHLWNLVTFGIHQMRADGLPRDGLFRQQQALLRTLPTPSALLADHLKLWWFWRQKSDRALARIALHWFLALLFTISSLMAGIFSSYIVTSDSINILVQSDMCGFLDVQPNETWDDIDRGYLSSIYPLSKRLVDECYLAANNDSVSTQCNSFARRNIPLKQERIPCPFDRSMCVGNMSLPAVSLDSGLLDLNDAFGLNLPPEDRVKFRKRTSCGVLPLDDRVAIVNATGYPAFGGFPKPGEQLRLFLYGTMVGQDTAHWANATFYQSFLKANVSEEYTVRDMLSFSDPARLEYSSFTPLPEMKRDDADVGLMYIGKNSIAYEVPVNDTIFAAHRREEHKSYGLQDITVEYYSDDPGTVLGCTEQYQFCVTQPKKNDSCTSLGPLPNKTIPSLANASDMQKAILKHIINSCFLWDITNAQDVLASDLLRSGAIRDGLPDDQWINEVVGWTSQVWAGLQVIVPDFAIGAKARDPNADAYVVQPQTDSERALCGMQKMPKSGGFVNINVFALVFIITLSVVVTILDLSILRFLIHMSKFRKALAPRINRWIQDGVLQLQRRAYEAHGEGSWTRLGDELPLTVDAVALAELPIESVKTHVQRVDTAKTAVGSFTNDEKK